MDHYLSTVSAEIPLKQGAGTVCLPVPLPLLLMSCSEYIYSHKMTSPWHLGLFLASCGPLKG